MDLDRFRVLGVEPSLFLYMLAFMITSVVEQAFYLDKACRVELKFPTEVCDNIKDKKYSNYSHRAQDITADFTQNMSIVSNVIPIFLAFFLGSWSDKVGRKIPLLLGLFGNFVFSFMVAVSALKSNWGLQPILWGAFLPCSLTGGNMTVFMAAFSYLSDTTSQNSRTFRVTILEVVYLVTMPLGTAIGSPLFQVLNHSYAAMFAINASCLLLALLYSFIFLSWRTAPEHHPSVYSCAFGLIDWHHAVESVKTIFKKRSAFRRRYLCLSLIAMGFYTFEREEDSLMYIFTQEKFRWSVTPYSHFKTFQSSFYVVGLVLGVPLFDKIFSIPETLMIMIGVASNVTARTFFIISKTPLTFYVGAGLGLLGPIVAPVLRSVVSKLVPSSERGKVFAIFSVADSSVPLISGPIYAKVYTYTLRSFPEAFFIVTITAMIIVFFISLYMQGALGGKRLKEVEDIKEPSGSAIEINASENK